MIDPQADGLGDPELFADATHNDPAGVTWLDGEVAHEIARRGLLDGKASGAQ